MKNLKNLIMLSSPHIAGWSYESKEKMAQVILENSSKIYIIATIIKMSKSIFIKF